MLTLLVALSSVARAQEGFDAHGFRPVALDGDVRDPLTVLRPGAFDGGDFFFSGLAEYARSPLVRLVETEAGQEVRPVVDNLVPLNLSLGVAPHERVRVDLMAPVYALSTGEDLAVDGPAMGDVRGSLLIALLRPDKDDGGAGLALLGEIDAPTGSPARFLGQPGVGGGGRLAFTFEHQRFTLTTDAGARFRQTVDAEAGIGSDLVTGGIGFGLQTSDTVGFTLEGTTGVPLPDPTPVTLPPIEVLLSSRYVANSGAFFTFGGAAGLTSAPGAAAFRLFIGGGYARRDLGPTDIDTIGVLRSTDLCPLQPETSNGWKDEDGCPDKLSALSVELLFRGAPRAAQAEIVGPGGDQSIRIGEQGLSLDAVPGSEWRVSARDGCLAGEASAVAGELGTKLTVNLAPKLDARVRLEIVGPDGQPLPSALVAWSSDNPDCVPTGTKTADAFGRLTQEISVGVHRVIVTAPGHNVVEQPINLVSGDDRTVRLQLAPSKIVLEQRQIRILEKVQFETGKAIISAESYGLLNEVAGVIKANPGIGRVEVGGHTDNKGSDDLNLRLSRDRANAVKDYLIAQGVDGSKLVAVGYGETKPLDTNKTEQGREANRRVEFNLLDQPPSKP